MNARGTAKVIKGAYRYLPQAIPMIFISIPHHARIMIMIVFSLGTTLDMAEQIYSL